MYDIHNNSACSYAGHSFTVSMPCSEQGIAMPSYEPFAVDAERAGGLLFALTVDDTFYPSEKGELIGDFECGAADFGVYCLANGAYQMLISPPGGDYCGLLQTAPDFSTATIATRGDDGCRTFAVNNALMLMYAFASAEMGTLLVHASVIKNGGKGYLFLGKSGTGKSTHSSLWLKYIEGSQLLNDDNPIVRVFQDEVIVYGSPWSGKTPCYKNDFVPLAGIVRLSQAPYNKVERLVPLKAYASLMPSCSCMRWDRKATDRLHATVEKVIMNTGCWHLECLPDADAAHVCCSAVKC